MSKDPTASPTPFLQVESLWVDSVLTHMSTEEKAGQLILLHSDLSDPCAEESLYQWVENKQVGGLLLENLELLSFLDLTHRLAKIAEVPLLNGTGEQVLINSQFSDMPSLPNSGALSAVASDSLKEILLQLYYKQAYQLGINFTLGSPFKARQPYGERFIAGGNHYRVLGFGGGIQLKDLFAAKDTACLLDPLLYPYKHLVHQGISGFWIDARQAPEDSIQWLPKFFLRQHFRSDLHFEGLITVEVEEEQIPEMIHAGADIFVVRSHPEKAHDQLMLAIEDGRLSPASLNDRVRRVLKAKYWMFKENPAAGAEPEIRTLQASFAAPENKEETFRRLDDGMLWSHFNDEKWDVLQWKLYEQALVLLNNRDKMLPFNDLLRDRYHLIHYGSWSPRVFKNYVSKYADFSSQLQKIEKGEALPPVESPKGKRAVTIVTLDDLLIDAKRDTAFLKSLRQLNDRGRLVLVNFGELVNFEPFDSSFTMVHSFERNEYTEALSAQLLFGGIGARGLLPADVNDYFKEGMGASTEAIRLKYGLPQEVGIAPEKLVGINAIVNSAIKKGAMPGCQVLVAKGGNIIYSDGFGYHSFQKRRKVSASDMYDVASVTKIAATTLVAMELYDAGQFQLEDRLKDHLQWEKWSSIQNIPLKLLFTHQSGLQPNMPIARYLLYRNNANVECDSFFCKYPTDTFAIRIADSFYFDRRHLDQIWERVHRLPVRNQRRYQYSDLNFMLIKEVLENKTQAPLDGWLDEYFYGPLGLRHNAFNPVDRYNREEIVPTQNDYKWRRQLLQGYVHDETAALFGGVGGHAGLFSNAEDLAVIFQMLLNQGKYGGHQFIKPETIQLFTGKQSGSNRGLGFDLLYRSSLSSYVPRASANTYGHTGFTGTVVWVDPDNELIFIFLSNRIHPSAFNKKIFQYRVRERVHQVIYNALDTYDFNMPDLPVIPGHKVKGVVD